MTECQEHQDRELEALARSSLSGVPRLADDLVDRLWGEVYEPEGPVPKDDLWRSCNDNIGSILTALCELGPAPAELLQAARATGTRRAYQHCPLNWVLHAWREGGQVMWAELARHAGASETAQLTDLVDSAGRLWGVTERFSIEMATTYQRLAEEHAGGPDRYLLGIVDALLDGHISQVRTEAEHALRLRPGTRMLVLTSEVHGSDTCPARQTVAALEDAGFRPVWRLRGGCLVGLVATEDERVGELVDVLRVHATTRFGVSPVLSDLAEIPNGHRLALLAMSTLPAGQSGVVPLDERLPEALMLSSPELAERVVSVTFGPILALPAAERDELLETVSAWIDALGSTHRAAKALYCHRNTVLNRLKRAESLTNLDFGEVRNWPQVIMALSALGRNGRTRSG